MASVDPSNDIISQTASGVAALSEEFFKKKVGDLQKDRSRDKSVTSLAAEAKAHYEQANTQRKIIFYTVLIMGIATWVAVVAFVGLVSFRVIAIETPIAVAFITALSAQVFGLMFTLSKGLYAWTITSKVEEDTE